MSQPKFKIGDTLEVLTLQLGESDAQKRGYTYYRFKVAHINQMEGTYFYSDSSAHVGWRAKWLQKVDA